MVLGKTPRHYGETIPHYFDHLKNMFFEGGVYVTPPFDLDSQDLPEAYLHHFLFMVKTIKWYT